MTSACRRVAACIDELWPIAPKRRKSLRTSRGEAALCGGRGNRLLPGSTRNRALEATAREPLADARRLEDPVEPVDHARRAGLDVLEAVAAEEERGVVLLEDRLAWVARETDRIEQRSLGTAACGRAAIDREVAVGCGGDLRAEVRQTPRDGDGKAGRRVLVIVVEAAQHVL